MRSLEPSVWQRLGQLPAHWIGGLLAEHQAAGKSVAWESDVAPGHPMDLPQTAQVLLLAAVLLAVVMLSARS